MKRLVFLALILIGSSITALTTSFATEPRDVTITIQATDNLSGAFMMQIAEDKLNPPPAIPFAQSTVIRTSADVLYIRVQDRAENWSNWITSVIGDVPIIQNPSPSPTPVDPGPGPGPGGGGGGGGFQQSTFSTISFQVVDPTDLKKIYINPVCMEIFSQSSPKELLANSCSGAQGKFEFLLSEGKLSIRVYSGADKNIFREYSGEIVSGAFTMNGGVFFAGTNQYAVTFPLATPTPSASPTPTPTSTPSASPTPSQSPSQTPTTTVTPATLPVQVKNNYFSTLVKTPNVPSIVVKGLTSSTSISKSKPVVAKFTVLPKNTVAKLTITLPTGVIVNLPSGKTNASGAFTVPGMQFAKTGVYTLTIKVGKTTKKLKVTITK